MTFRRLLRAWDRFLFRPISPAPIAVYRILFGLLVIADLLLLLPDLDTFFGEQGVLPMASALHYLKMHRLNVLQWLPNRPVWMHATFAVTLAAAVCLTAG